MNAWLLAADALALGLLPCGLVALRGPDPVRRLVGLEMGAVLLSLELVLLCMAQRREAFLDLALALALLSLGGGLVFARFLERWL